MYTQQFSGAALRQATKVLMRDGWKMQKDLFEQMSVSECFDMLRSHGTGCIACATCQYGNNQGPLRNIARCNNCTSYHG